MGVTAVTLKIRISGGLVGFSGMLTLLQGQKYILVISLLEQYPDSTHGTAEISLDLSVENRVRDKDVRAIISRKAEVTGFNKLGELVDFTMNGKIIEDPILKKASLSLKTLMKNPELWSTETPDLYHLTIKIKTKKG